MNIRSVHSLLFGAIVLILSAYAQEDSHAELEATNKLNEVQNNDLAINGAKIVQESKFLKTIIFNWYIFMEQSWLATQYLDTLHEMQMWGICLPSPNCIQFMIYKDIYFKFTSASCSMHSTLSENQVSNLVSFNL